MIDPDTRRQAIGLLKSKPTKTYREVAEAVGVSISTIYVWAQEAKIHKPDMRKHGVKAQRNKELIRLRETESLSHIASRFGLSKRRVQQILKSS